MNAFSTITRRSSAKQKSVRPVPSGPRHAGEEYRGPENPRGQILAPLRPAAPGRGLRVLHPVASLTLDGKSTQGFAPARREPSWGRREPAHELVERQAHPRSRPTKPTVRAGPRSRS